MKTAGLLDLQVNGYAGVDFNDPAITPADMDTALSAMSRHGVTACLPTLITAAPDALEARFRALDAAISGSELGPKMVPGYHLEGPFLRDEPGYSGCHPSTAMSDPDAETVLDLENRLSRPILLITLAPERNGAVKTIRALKSAGKTISVGHSAAGYADIKAGAEAGLSLSTHLGNGLPQVLPKLENTLLAQLSEPLLTACFIADGIHMSPEALAALIALKGIDRCILVTDAVSAAGAAPGPYRFAGMDIEHEQDGRVANPGGVGLAGSALQLDEAVRNIADWGIADFGTAVRMASEHPLAAISKSLSHHGISLSLGQVNWDEGRQPGVIAQGGVA